jgi:hypothetical protein
MLLVHRSTLVALTVAAFAASAACAILDGPAQCSSDGDCARFNATCDIGRAVCVPGSAPSEESLSGKLDGSVGTLPSSTPPGQSTVPPKCAIQPKPTAIVATVVPAAGSSDDAGVDGSAPPAGHTIQLDCDKDWILDATLIVSAGTTLTIAPSTTIRAKPGANAAIIVQPGGKILADGQRDAPIVFTVDSPAPKTGDWRGLYVLGKAPRTTTNPYEGDAQLAFGGTERDDSSGVLSFVRVEYSSAALVFGSVGSGTRVDSVDVRRTGDNCFVLTGGTMDAKHLVCQEPGDDFFEMSDGYTGRLQFLFGQRVAAGDDHHGLLFDGVQTSPTIYNATLCGQSPATAGQSFGLLFRNQAAFDTNDAIVTGWGAGLNAVAPLGTPILRASLAFGNTANPGRIDDPDDDNGFDETAAFRDAGNLETDPKIVDCISATEPKPWPAASLAAGARPPPAGFFDVTAAYIGAFKDESDRWMTGAWVRFAAE